MDNTKEYIPVVKNGGVAIRVGNNLYYMKGRKHNRGGINIGKGNKLEVEDGEVLETSNNEIKVFSAVPMLNGLSPAELVLSGVNTKKVFNAQENIKKFKR